MMNVYDKGNNDEASDEEKETITTNDIKNMRGVVTVYKRSWIKWNQHERDNTSNSATQPYSHSSTIIQIVQSSGINAVGNMKLSINTTRWVWPKQIQIIEPQKQVHSLMTCVQLKRQVLIYNYLSSNAARVVIYGHFSMIVWLKYEWIGKKYFKLFKL